MTPPPPPSDGRRDGRTALVTAVSFVVSGSMALTTQLTSGADGAFHWTLVLVAGAVGTWGAVRRRLGTGAILLAVAVVIAATTASAFTYESVTMRWLCVVGLTTLPMVTLVLLDVRWSALAALMAYGGQLSVVVGVDAGGPELLAAGAVLAVVMAVCTSYPARLLRLSDTARATAESAATHDALTHLLNRRGMVERAPLLLAEAHRSGRDVAVLVIDVDHFKAVNDAHGHDVGDVVLVALADVLRTATATGTGAACVRLGGEEFAVLLACDGSAAALAVAERLRRAASLRRTPGAPDTTVSVGVAVAPAVAGGAEGERLLSHLLGAADLALYAAKTAGRDRVRLGAPLGSAASHAAA